jgi:hypothetical protein
MGFMGRKCRCEASVAVNDGQASPSPADGQISAQSNQPLTARAMSQTPLSRSQQDVSWGRDHRVFSRLDDSTSSQHCWRALLCESRRYGHGSFSTRLPQNRLSKRGWWGSIWPVVPSFAGTC